jgi:hypothetical protein
VGAALEVPADQRECNNVPILCRELQAHVELVFKYFTVEAVEQINLSELFPHIKM